jgi:hypothetical protein
MNHNQLEGIGVSNALLKECKRYRDVRRGAVKRNISRNATSVRSGYAANRAPSAFMVTVKRGLVSGRLGVWAQAFRFLATVAKIAP